MDQHRENVKAHYNQLSNHTSDFKDILGQMEKHVTDNHAAHPTAKNTVAEMKDMHQKIHQIVDTSKNGSIDQKTYQVLVPLLNNSSKEAQKLPDDHGDGGHKQQVIEHLETMKKILEAHRQAQLIHIEEEEELAARKASLEAAQQQKHA